MLANPRVGGLSRKDSKSRGKQDHVPLKLSSKSKHCFLGESLGYIGVGAFLLNPTRSPHFFSFFSREDLILCDIDISPLERCLPHISGFLLPLSTYDMFSTQGWSYLTIPRSLHQAAHLEEMQISYSLMPSPPSFPATSVASTFLIR